MAGVALFVSVLAGCTAMPSTPATYRWVFMLIEFNYSLIPAGLHHTQPDVSECLLGWIAH